MIDKSYYSLNLMIADEQLFSIENESFYYAKNIQHENEKENENERIVGLKNNLHTFYNLFALLEKLFSFLSEVS